MNKVELWLNAIINEDGHKMSAGSLRTIEMLRSEFKRLQNLQQTDVSRRLSNKDVLLIKGKILHCLVDDFKGNQAIFDRQQGWQVFNGTDLSMVMDSVVKGLKFAQSELNDR